MKALAKRRVIVFMVNRSTGRTDGNRVQRLKLAVKEHKHRVNRATIAQLASAVLFIYSMAEYGYVIRKGLALSK